MAYAVPRSFGSAVQRNRVRRRLREIVRSADRSGQLPGLWILVGVMPGRGEPTHSELERWFHRAIDRLGSAPGLDDTRVGP